MSIFSRSLKTIAAAAAFAIVAGASQASVIQSLPKTTPAKAANELAQVVNALAGAGVTGTSGYLALGKIDESAPRLGGLGTYASEAGYGKELDFKVTFGTKTTSELRSIGGNIVDPKYKLQAVLIVDGTHSAIWYDGMFSDMFVTDANGKRKGISHISYFGTVAAVPLPAAGLMLLAGLGGFAAMRRRKKT